MKDLAHNADWVRVITEAWQRKLDAAGLELWQHNRPESAGSWGEGPIGLHWLAVDAVEALRAHIDGLGAVE